ncbi:MAG: hypothetical protein JWS10_465 [Cypionkella sp.]|nr:hypothetical protein [Cypionkella sp.]
MIAQYWLLAALAATIVVAMIASVPRRWTRWVMALVVVSPVILYVGAFAWEVVTRPGAEDVFANAMLGFSLLSAILLIPWGVTCVVLFALGLGFRRLFRGREVADAKPVALRQANIAPAQVATLPAAIKFSTMADDGSRDAIEWRHAHIGFENDGLKIGGQDVWGQKWRDVGAAPLRLSHPSYPLQMHLHAIYEIGNGPSATRFAASEVSNGVWSFYVSTRYVTETSAVSADGSLRFEQRAGEMVNGRLDSVGTCAVLVDVVTNKMLLDCGAWSASEITNSADGSLLLRLDHKDGETLLRIFPASRTFRDQGMNGPALPLADLAATVERARYAAAHQTEPTYRRISPDGSIRIDLVATEWGNSQWVYSPRVTDIASGRVVLDLWNTDWDATVSYPANRRLSLDFRRYHFSGNLTIELDLNTDRYRITREPGGGENLPSGPLHEAAAAMEESGRRTAKFATARPVFNDRPNPFAAWRAALVILLGALALIAVATFLSLHLAGDKPQLLRQIPKLDLSKAP